ncbi:MAG: tetratricopeptide repeat protein [Bdellovibrionota bacterium]
MIEARSQRPAALWLLLCGAAFGSFLAIYLRSLSYQPMFDDFSHVVENRAIRYLFHPRIFFESEYTRARPLPYITFAISYWLSGLSLSGLRVWSLALHFANALLAGLLFRAWFGERGRLPWGALAAALLFLLHPLAVDSVIYFSARGTLLVTFFVFLALLVHARERQNAVSLGGFLFFTLLAFFSRESAAALGPLIIAVHLLTRRRHTELAPYLAPLLFGGCVILWIKAGYLNAAWNGFFSIQGEVDLHSGADYFRLSLSIWPRLLELLFNPFALSLDHSLVLPASWLSAGVLEGIALWALFAFSLAGFLVTRNRWLFPVCWLFLSLLPTNSFFPLLDPLSERHLYLALPALAWFFGLCVQALAARGAALAAVAAVAVIFLGDTITLSRVLDWSSPARLWLAAYERAPEKVRVAFNAASFVETYDGDTEKAIRLLVKTLAHHPPGSARYQEQTELVAFLAGSLDSLAQDQGKKPREVAQELGLGGGFWGELVQLEEKIGKVPGEQWRADWQAALSRVADTPVSPRAQDLFWVKNSFLLLKGKELRLEGKIPQARELYERVILAFSYSHIPYWIERENLGDLYAASGNDEQAIKQYELAAFQYKVFKRFPPLLQQKLFSLFSKRGDMHRASDALGELVRLRTDDPELRGRYAEYLRRIGSRHAVRQEREAEFYGRNSVSASDPREQLRP